MNVSAGEAPSSMSVTVVYAAADSQRCVTVNLARGSTIADAINRSRLLQEFPDIDLDVNKVGIYGELHELGDVPRDGDRIEIYRPLKVDPKELRRRRSG